MDKKQFSIFFILSVCLFLVYCVSSGIGIVQANQEVDIDIMLVIDNSGSMIKNDPGFLLKSVVMEFLSGFKKNWRLGMVIFDQDIRLVLPLTDISPNESNLTVRKSIENIKYDGFLSDTPGAIERAIYELKINGRNEAKKVIILLTDGIVDTGNKDKDMARERWLKNNLTTMSKKSEIRIFGIAFTDQADFSLIQTLAQRTDGEYFRAQQIEDIGHIINIINRLIIETPEKKETHQQGSVTEKTSPDKAKEEIEQKPSAIQKPPDQKRVPETTPPPVKATDSSKPVSQPVIGKTGFLYQIFTGLIILLLIIIIFLILTGQTIKKETKILQQFVPEKKPLVIPKAELVDVKNVTGKKTITINKKSVTIGRDKNNYITIPDETVSSFHASIEFREGFFYLEDQRSKNKTYLNGSEIASSSPIKLKSGDEIRFNLHKFIFILPHLIPSGKTVINFKGKNYSKTDNTTLVEKKEIKNSATVAYPRAMLIDVKNITGNKTFALQGKVTKIGRDVLNDISIRETAISGFHATIEYKEGAFYLEDQRSKNKTFLNGNEIKSHQASKLKSGDEIMFFTYKFIFLIERQVPTGDTGER